MSKTITFEHIHKNVKISVSTEYNHLISSPVNLEYIWNYNVSIENQSEHNIQLMYRFWNIVDTNGCIKEVEGEGVIGTQPIIAPNQSFNYNSYVLLHTDSGIMAGEYEMLDLENRKIFNCTIPTFSLDLPNHDKNLNN